MKPTALALCTLLGTATAANAQLSVTPQLGLAQSKTSIISNNAATFSPTGINANYMVNLRADYRFKKGHSPYVSIGTAPGALTYSFGDVGTAATNFSAIANNVQLKLEGGYQYSSKPIRLEKTRASQPQLLHQEQPCVVVAALITTVTTGIHQWQQNRYRIKQ